MDSRRTRIRSILLIFCLIGILFSFEPKASKAAEKEDSDNVVRVGWFQSQMFQEGASDDQEKRGYSYDYLQKVSNYTKWRYEYVYGDWTELYHMLLTGEIDLLAGVSRTEERSTRMLFPDTPMGTDRYYLYKHDQDSGLSVRDLSSFSGKKVGGIVDNRTTELIEKWIEENQVQLEVIRFESFEEMEKAFSEGKLDLLGQTIFNVLSMDNLSQVAKIGEEPFYMAVNRERRDLLEQLNQAVSKMLSTDPFALQNMQYENYGSVLTSRNLTEEEKQWIQEHPVLLVGYLKDYLPYSDMDEEGNLKGILRDVLDAILSSLGLEKTIEIQYKGYTDYSEMVEALDQQEIMAAFPVYGNLWYLEQAGIDASRSVITGTETMFYKGSKPDSQQGTIAVNEKNAMQIVYCHRYYPEAQLLSCSSIEECLESVLTGKADFTVINSMRIELVTGDSQYSSLSQTQLTPIEERCFGVDDQNTELLMLLNRGLGLIGSSYGLDSSYKYLAEFHQYKTIDFIRDHLWQIGLTTAGIVSLTIFLLSWNLKRKAAIVKEKEAHIQQINAINLELEELREKAEAASKAKSTFLFNMSHDLRTPMNAIMGYTDILRNSQASPEKQQDYLRKIDDSSQFLLSLIDNVLETARIESGNRELVETIWRVDRFNDMIFSVFEEQMKKKKIDFIRSIHIEHEYVYCDRVKLGEIFLNILSNAYKYTPEGGTVRMDLKEIPSSRAGYVRFRTEISDTGSGMSEEFLPHLFEEFSREKTATDNKIEGTGLGMSIVKKLTDLMGGTIEVSSKIGRGTTFIVTLEHRIAGKKTSDPSVKTKVSPERFKGRRILLAEDNELNAEIVMEILFDIGFLVDWVQDGELCVKKYQLSDPGYYDLILMDVQMPKLNGYEAAQRIRKSSDTMKALIPIIAMTANVFEEDIEKAYQSGMNGHLEKPVDVRKLMETLAAFLKTQADRSGKN